MSIALGLSALGIGLLVCQALFAELVPVWFRPDLVLVFAAAMGLHRASPMQGLLHAFGIGFAMDVLSGSPPGLYALLRGTACAATRLLDRSLYVSTPLSWGLYCGVYWLFDRLAFALLLGATLPDAAPPWGELARNAPGAALLTAVVAGGLLRLFNRFDSEPDLGPEWRSASPSDHRVRL